MNLKSMKELRLGVLAIGLPSLILPMLVASKGLPGVAGALLWVAVAV